MQEYMEQWKTDYNPEYPPFQGGAIGYFSYDCIRYIEKLPSLAEDDINIPDIFFYYLMTYLSMIKKNKCYGLLRIMQINMKRQKNG